MNHPPKVYLYIAGPMTGIPQFNHPTFNEAARGLTDDGYAVLNPASNFDGRTDLPYAEYMRAAVHLLLQADAIAVLPGWENSPGARMEMLLAQKFGLDTFKLLPPEPGEFLDWSLSEDFFPVMDALAKPEGP